MGNTSKNRAGKRSTVPSALSAEALSTAARSPLGETVPLGFLEGVTDEGFRLVWEGGSLLLVAYSPLRLDTSLVDGVRKRLDWIASNKSEVQKRLNVVVGPGAEVTDCDVRVVVGGDDKACRSTLNQLSGSVELRIVPVDRLTARSRWTPKVYMLGKTNKPLARPISSRGTEQTARVREPGHDVHSLILELRQVATELSNQNLVPDPDDWRCCPDLNLVRLYGLLVTIGCAIGVTPPSPGRRTTSGTRSAEAVRPAVYKCVFESLSVLAKAVARNCFRVSDRDVARTVRRIHSLLSSLSGKAEGSHGAYLGAAWRSPVPPDFSSLVESMAVASNASKPGNPQRKERSDVARLLTATNFGVASTVHFAQTFDQGHWPRFPVNNDSSYRQAAIARVLAGHRLLIEILGVNSFACVRAMLSFAQEIALEKTFDAFWDAGKQAEDFLAAARQGALAVLSGSGKVTTVGKRRVTLRRIAIAQEPAVVGAMKAVAATGGD